MRQAKQEALRIVEENRNKSEALLKEMQEQLKASGVNQRELQKQKDKMREMENQLHNAIPQEQYAGLPPREIALGQMVDIPKLRQHGYILTLPNSNGDLQVQAGILKITVNISDLRASDKEEGKTGHTRLSGLQMQKASQVNAEIDLRGQLPEEALENLGKYLDDAYMAGLKRARVIHGKGTGVLRKTLQAYLKTHPLVESYQIGDYFEGGMGVTVVELKP